MKLNDTLRLLLDRKGHDVWSIDPDTTVYDALVLMSEKRIGALPVLAGGKPVGLFSERDYARKVILKGRSSKETAVKEIMTTPLICVTPEHTVEECMEIMTSKRFRHLPVMEEETLIGIVSIGDLVNWIILAQEATIHQLHNYIAGNYPA